MFTFQYGSIKAIYKDVRIEGGMRLHSNMDRLKLVPFLCSYYTPVFTFQYGSIKAESIPDSPEGVIRLHSNMDRLKHMQTRGISAETTVYIPIWID